LGEVFVVRADVGWGGGREVSSFGVGEEAREGVVVV